jgi:hypothetical protein
MVDKKLRVPEDRAAKGMAQPLSHITTKIESAPIHDTRKRIAHLIRAELVCCDIYEKINGGLFDDKTKHADDAREYSFRLYLARKNQTWHSICYYGEWSAQLAESGDLPEHVFYGPSDEHPASGSRADRPRRIPDPRND